MPRRVSGVRDNPRIEVAVSITSHFVTLRRRRRIVMSASQPEVSDSEYRYIYTTLVGDPEPDMPDFPPKGNGDGRFSNQSANDTVTHQPAPVWGTYAWDILYG